MPPRQNLLLRLTISLTTATVAMSSSLWGAPAAAAVPSYTAEERAFAMVAPALVYLEMNARGFLRRKATGEALNTAPIVVTNRCSGFVVGPEGHAVTNTHCVRPTPEAIHFTAVSQFAADSVRGGRLTNPQRETFIRDTLSTTEFTGPQAGSKSAVTIHGQLFQGRSGLVTEPSVEAQVVAAQAPADGDVTLLKFALGDMPTAVLSSQPLDTNAPIVLIGYGGETGAVTFTSKFKPGKIVGRYDSRTPSLYEMDSEIGNVSHGGMVVDLSGNVLGMINVDPSSREKSNRLITNLEHIKKLMADANLSNNLTAADNAYRNGLNDYFGGRYSQAIKSFDSVLALMPNHAFANLYRTQATERLATEGDPVPAGLPTWVIALLAGLSGAVVLAIIALLVMSRRRAAPQPQLSVYAPVSGMPISGLPTSVSPVSAPQGVYYDYMSAMKDPSQYEQEPTSGYPFIIEQSAPAADQGDSDRRTWGPQGS